MCDKYDAESINLLKIDALGLTQLSIIEDCLKMIGKKSLVGYRLNDKKAFKVLNDWRFSGIFQFEGFSLQSLVQQCEITEFNDIVAKSNFSFGCNTNPIINRTMLAIVIAGSMKIILLFIV